VSATSRAAGRVQTNGRSASPEVGATLWFTGLPSAGKSTIAHALARRLQAEGRRVQVLDGDEVRPHLSAGLGFSRADRDVNVTRIGWVARLLASHGVIVLVPVIAPYAAARQAVRDDHAAAQVPFAEVFVSTPLAVAENRDVKGLYAKARNGDISGMTGVDDPYEEPRSAELVLDTTEVDLDTSVELAGALLSAILEDL
jgi:adenylylsulfate kinase